MARAPQENERVEKWEEHYNSLVYYHVARVLAGHIGQRSKSIIDVGSAGYPYLNWFGHIEDRVSLDLKNPFDGEGVEAVRADFIEYDAGRLFDIAMCMQVMEHLPEPKPFARKLLRTAKTVIISLPYKWEKGWASTHIQDPVDREKLFSWFGRKPNFEYICHEIRIERPRIFQVYEGDSDRWSYTGERNRQRVARHEAKQAGEPLPKDAFDSPRPPLYSGNTNLEHQQLEELKRTYADAISEIDARLSKLKV